MSALRGLRIIELSSRAAGAFCTKLLADLGATVIKIEPGGDPGRASASEFRYLNTGKSSVAADAIDLLELLRDVDVLVDDADHPALADIDLDALDRLVWCSIRPFGLDGPYAPYRATPLTTFQAGGEGHLLPSGVGFTMFPDRPPLQIAPGVVEHDSGVTAAVAVLGALHQRHRTHRGQRIEVSDQEAQLALNRTRLSRYNNDGVVMHRSPSPYPVGGMMACRDGYVQLVGIREEQWKKVFGDAPFASAKDQLPIWCRGRSKHEVATLLADAGCAVGEYLEPPELLDSEQLRHRQFFQHVDGDELPGAPYRLSRTPVVLAPPQALGSFTGFTEPRWTDLGGPAGAPLEGVRVIDFTWAAAGPYATLLLALLGADVIKVESPRNPDPARRGFLADYGGPERSPNYNELNLNKRSICIDLADAGGRRAVESLIATSDVVVENFRPGVIARLGFAPERLLAAYPRLVVASSSANGSTGPEAHAAGLASIFGATGGLSTQTGYADGPPSEIGESTDYRSANFLALAILAALAYRDRTGEGQYIDLASREAVIALAPYGLLRTGNQEALRMGNRHRQHAPHNVYRCAGDDAWVAIAITDDVMWQSMCSVLGRDHWRTLDAAARRRDEGQLDGAIAQWTSTRSPHEAFIDLQAVGVAAAPSFTNEQLATDPHLAARGVFVEVEHPVIGRQRVMRAPWRMSSSACRVKRHGPLLDQDRAIVEEDR